MFSHAKADRPTERAGSHRWLARSHPWTHWAYALVATALSTLVCLGMNGRLAMADLVMVQLLGVVIVALRTGLYPSIFTAALSTASFDFFIVPPYARFRPIDPSHFITLGVMLLVAVVVTGLVERERRQGEAALQARADADTERLRNALLSSVSHDLRTPLTAITGAASTLLEDDAVLDVGTRLDLAQTIFEEADRLNRLLGKLLYMTRLESGTLHVRKEWQPLEDVIGTAVDRLEAKIGPRALITHHPDAVPSAPFDAVLIEQVLVNLIENALVHAPAETPIEISTSATEASITVEIADRGAGVPREERQRIFQKFYRRGAGNTHEGLGLGLTICQAIVLAHGGRIWVEDRPGGGASFHFTLPLDPHPTREKPLPELGDNANVRLNDRERRAARTNH